MPRKTMEGQEFCDFVGVLREKGMFLVVEKILKHLDLPSLENAAKVSYEWGQAILIETKNYLCYSLAVTENWKKGHFNQFESDIDIAISDVQFDGKHIAVFSSGIVKRVVSKIFVFDRSTLQLKSTINLQKLGFIVLCKLHLSGNLLAADFSTSFGPLCVWDIATQQLIHKVDSQNIEGNTDGLKFSSRNMSMSRDDGKLLVTVTNVNRSSLHVCEVRQFRSPGNEMVVAHQFELQGQVQFVKDVFVDNDYIVIHYLAKKSAGSPHKEDNFIDVLNTQTAELLHSIAIDRSDTTIENRIVDFNYLSGKIVVAYGRGGYKGPHASIKLWNAQSGSLLRSINLETRKFSILDKCSIVSGKFIVGHYEHEYGKCLGVWDLEQMVNSTGPVETNGSSFLLESLKLTDLKLENCNKITGDERSLLLIGTRHDEDMERDDDDYHGNDYDDEAYQQGCVLLLDFSHVTPISLNPGTSVPISSWKKCIVQQGDDV